MAREGVRSSGSESGILGSQPQTPYSGHTRGLHPETMQIAARSGPEDQLRGGGEVPGHHTALRSGQASLREERRAKANSSIRRAIQGGPGRQRELLNSVRVQDFVYWP